MERDQKKVKVDSLRSRKNEARKLLRSSFGNVLFSLVPFEVWRDLIVSSTDLKTIFMLSQTCYAFKEMVDIIGENNFNLALLLRREGQIDLAKKYLLLCAENNNPFAMFHQGYAHVYSGWGLEIDEKKGAEWLKKSSELGNAQAIAYFSEYLLLGFGVEENAELSNVWAKKALSSNNSFAIGYCYFAGFGTEEDLEKAFLCFEASAKEGDEFGQYYFGFCFRYGQARESDAGKAFYWWLKSAEQGNCEAQHYFGAMYRDGVGCEQDEQKAIIWYKKSAKQGNEYSLRALKNMGIEKE